MTVKKSAGKKRSRVPEVGLGLVQTPEGYKRADGSSAEIEVTEPRPPVQIARLTEEPRCPTCRERLDLTLKYKRHFPVEDDVLAKDRRPGRYWLYSVYCCNCGLVFSADLI